MSLCVLLTPDSGFKDSGSAWASSDPHEVAGYYNVSNS